MEEEFVSIAGQTNNHKGATKMKFSYDNENERSRFLQGQVQWAHGILANPNIKFASGKMSHDCALDVLEQAQDELIDHLVLIP